MRKLQGRILPSDLKAKSSDVTSPKISKYWSISVKTWKQQNQTMENYLFCLNRCNVTSSLQM